MSPQNFRQKFLPKEKSNRRIKWLEFLVYSPVGEGPTLSGRSNLERRSNLEQALQIGPTLNLY
jgi:hypothetical protein